VKILLIYPEFPDTFWSFKHALPFVRKRSALPPLGLLTVAALLPGSWDRRLVDLNVRPLTGEDLEWADYVFVGAMAVQQESVGKVLARCRAAKVPVVAGGPLFTAEPDRFTDVDHLVLGEAELALPEFLDDLTSGCPRRLYRAQGFADMTTSPSPEWELLDIHAYASMSVQYSRGCPYDCEFCNVTELLGHRPRVKTSEQILAELTALYQRGWRRGVFFVDDNLIGNRRQVSRDLLPALREWRETRPGMVFNTEASINLADDPELMEAMVAAGFSMVFVGIETPDPAALAECNKSPNLRRDMIADVRRMQGAGLQVQGGFIVGFDSDTPASLTRIVEFIQAAGIVTAMVGLLQALPGTKLHARMRKASRLLPSSSGDNVSGSTNIVPLAGTRGLADGYKAAMRWLYSPKSHYQRIRTFLRDYKQRNPAALGNLREPWAALMPFVRSVFHLGIVGQERFEYWKLLAWTLIYRPRAVGLAITCAIYGYHFRRTCERHLV
jgi:radical SAM superfamily enzyme YgiQ (UPF0313 family)